MPALDIHQFLCRKDNFGVLLRDRGSPACAAIDAPEDGPIEQALRETGWKLTHILVTHHHADHVAAIPALKARHGAKVVANRADARRISTRSAAPRGAGCTAHGGVEYCIPEP